MTKTPEHDEALVEQRLLNFTTCGCGDDEWPHLRHDVLSLIRTTDAARIAELERQLVEYQRPTAEQVETFQQACERGFQMPSDPPPWPEMLKLAETFLARATLRSSPDAG